MAQKQRQRVIVMVGPTASGKSALAVRLARQFNCEVISADSRQVYRGLNIGTGKITKREMKGVRHHLLDVASPKEQFTANDFVLQASKAISDINTRGKLPIICGGTGFYIDALLGRIALSPVAPNAKLRAKLDKKSTAQLMVLLKKCDPKRAKTIDPHNKRRIIRALEIAASGTQTGNIGTFTKDSSMYEALWIGLKPSSQTLRKQITIRLFARIRKGMIAEAKRLHARGLSYKRMHELGLEYRSLARYLQNLLTRSEFERELEFAIWHYAKRQMSYWKRNNDIRWLPAKSAAKVVRKWLADSE